MSNKSSGFENLLVWQKSVDLSVDIYEITKSFPKEELFGLVSLIRRASVSVASNIAEGASRNSNKEFIQFLGIARGSISELKTQLLISRRINFIAEQTYNKIVGDLENVHSLLKKLKYGVSNRQN